jgi:DnaJ-domain-containing protein 1
MNEGFYPRLMTQLLDQALDAVRKLPSESQDEIARAILTLAAQEADPVPIEAEHLAAVLDGLGQIRRRELAMNAEVEAALRRFKG